MRERKREKAVKNGVTTPKTYEHTHIHAHTHFRVFFRFLFGEDFLPTSLSSPPPKKKLNLQLVLAVFPPLPSYIFSNVLPGEFCAPVLVCVRVRVSVVPCVWEEEKEHEEQPQSRRKQVQKEESKILKCSLPELLYTPPS